MPISGKKAKIASRERGAAPDTKKRYFSTRREDVVKTLEDGRIIARDDLGGYYLTEPRYVGLPMADPNRYGRPDSRLSEERLRELGFEPGAEEAGAPA